MMSCDSYFDELKVVFVGHFRNLHQGRFVKRPRFRLGLMTGTTAEKLTAGERFSAVCPILFFNFRDMEYCWNSPEKAPRESYFFDVEGPRADRMEATLQKDFPKGFLSCKDPTPFRMILDEMSDSFSHYRVQRPYRLPVLAEQFLAQVYTEWTTGSSSGKYERRIRETAMAIQQEPGETYDFQQYADDLKITLIHYRRLFKAVMGLSPYQYQQKCRLAASIRLLKNSKELQIQEIARLCGFQDPMEFSRFFRTQTGLSPRNYCKTFFE